MSSSQWEPIIYNNSILWKVSLNGDFPVPEGFDESLFSPIFAKKNRGMKMGSPAPFAKLFRKIDSFKWWLPKVKKSIRKGMLELNCWTMSVVFTWEDDEMDIQCVPVHPVVSHGFQGLTI